MPLYYYYCHYVCKAPDILSKKLLIYLLIYLINNLNNLMSLYDLMT